MGKEATCRARHAGATDVGVALLETEELIFRGKRGRVAQSIRTVTRAAAVRDDVEIDIEFLD